MTKNLSRLVLAGLFGLATVIGAVSCSQTESAGLEVPTFYDDSLTTQARPLIGEGYDLLDNDDIAGALAKFAEIETLIPSGLVGPYHSACAYARSGDKEAAFESLTQLVNNGYDHPSNLEGDSDLDPLREDPRMDQVIEQARQNYETGSAVFAAGMPDYDEAPMSFATEKELDEWSSQQSRRLGRHSRYWTSVGNKVARIDFAARKLSATRELKADDPEFDYGLERVRSVAGLGSFYFPGWGALSDLVVHEVDRYQETSPDPEGAAEANYRAGLALSLKYAKDDPNLTEGLRQAGSILAKVPEDAAFCGAAQALIVINKLQVADADTTALGNELRTIVEKNPGENYDLFRIISTQLSNGAASYFWPIELGMNDLDGQTITLEEYRGKALLIDFWAIWCPPCRAELPNLVQVYEEYHPKGFEIVSISLDYSDKTTPERYVEWTDSASMNWRHSYEGADWDTDAVKRYFVSGIPAPFLVGSDGSLVAWGEDCRGENLAKSVEKALQGSI